MRTRCVQRGLCSTTRSTSVPRTAPAQGDTVLETLMILSGCRPPENGVRGGRNLEIGDGRYQIVTGTVQEITILKIGPGRSLVAPQGHS